MSDTDSAPPPADGDSDPAPADDLDDEGQDETAASEDEAPSEEDAPSEEPPSAAAPSPEVALGRPVVKGRLAYALAALTGVLYFLSCPGADIWPLSLVALVPLIVALKGQTVRRATGLGWVAGFALTMIGFSWLRTMLATFIGMPEPVPILLMSLVCAYQAGRIALCGWFYARAAARGWPAAPVFATAFVASEMLYPLLFPWHFGATVHNALPLLQTAELGGPILVGLVLVTANLAVAELVERVWFGVSPKMSVVAVGLVVPLVAAVFGWVRIGQIQARQQSAPAVKVALVQGNQSLTTFKGARDRHKKLTAEARDAGAELVVWSESVVLQTVRTKDYKAEVTKQFGRHLKVPTIIGVELRFPAPKGWPRPHRSWNSALLVDREGAVVSRYDKRVLLMFGEYIPLGEKFPALYEASPNSGALLRGTSLAPLELDGHRYATSICYEDVIPADFNRAVRHADPDMLVNLTNDAWFGDTAEPWIHLALSKLRTVEHRRYLLRGTNTGVSAIVDATGAVVAHGGTFRAEVISGEARYLTGRTLYRLIGDIPWWFVALLHVGLCFVRRRGAKD